MSDPLDEPLPLVTATFTTEELAGMSAGLILLRRHLGQTLAELKTGLPYTAEKAAQVEMALADAIATATKLSDLVSQEQGQALLKKLFRK